MDTLATDLQTTDGMRQGSPFRFSRLVSAGEFTNIGQSIDINNRGVTVFSASTSSQPFEPTGIYTTRNGRSTETVADTQTLQTLFQDVTANGTNVTYGFDRAVDINNRNNVAFEGFVRFTESSPTGNQVTQIERLFLKDGNQFRTLGEAKATNPEGATPPQTKRNNIDNFSLNDNNQAVYETTLLDPSQKLARQALTFEGKELVVGISSGGKNDTLGNSKILNNGTIYYVNRRQDDQDRQSSIAEVFQIAPGSTTPTRIISDFRRIEGFDVNEAGKIALSGITSQGGPGGGGTFQFDMSGLKQVNEDLILPVDINSRGSIVTTQIGPSGQISLIRDGALQPVIKTGDQLMGEQAQTFADGSINDRNQIAFRVTFANGKVELFRADLRRSFSPKVNLANDEIAAPEEGDTEVALTV